MKKDKGVNMNSLVEPMKELSTQVDAISRGSSSAASAVVSGSGHAGRGH